MNVSEGEWGSLLRAPPYASPFCYFDRHPFHILYLHDCYPTGLALPYAYDSRIAPILRAFLLLSKPDFSPFF